MTTFGAFPMLGLHPALDSALRVIGGVVAGCLVLAVLAYMAGVGRVDNPRVLGVSVDGYYPPVTASETTFVALDRFAPLHDLSDWQLATDDQTVVSEDRPQRKKVIAFTITGKRDGSPVTIDVELAATDGSKFVLQKWSER